MELPNSQPARQQLTEIQREILEQSKKLAIGLKLKLFGEQRLAESVEMRKWVGSYYLLQHYRATQDLHNTIRVNLSHYLREMRSMVKAQEYELLASEFDSLEEKFNQYIQECNRTVAGVVGVNFGELPNPHDIVDDALNQLIKRFVDLGIQFFAENETTQQITNNTLIILSKVLNKFLDEIGLAELEEGKLDLSKQLRIHTQKFARTKTLTHMDEIVEDIFFDRVVGEVGKKHLMDFLKSNYILYNSSDFAAAKVRFFRGRLVDKNLFPSNFSHRYPHDYKVQMSNIVGQLMEAYEKNNRTLFTNIMRQIGYSDHTHLPPGFTNFQDFCQIMGALQESFENMRIREEKSTERMNDLSTLNSNFMGNFYYHLQNFKTRQLATTPEPDLSSFRLFGLKAMIDRILDECI
jgi:hypothetical protein